MAKIQVFSAEIQLKYRFFIADIQVFVPKIQVLIHPNPDYSDPNQNLSHIKSAISFFFFLTIDN